METEIWMSMISFAWLVYLPSLRPKKN